MISCRQAHPVKQEAVQQLCVRGDFLELLSCDKLAGNAVKRKLAAFIAVIIVECSWNTHTRLPPMIIKKHTLPSVLLDANISSEIFIFQHSFTPMRTVSPPLCWHLTDRRGIIGKNSLVIAGCLLLGLYREELNKAIYFFRFSPTISDYCRQFPVWFVVHRTAPFGRAYGSHP